MSDTTKYRSRARDVRQSARARLSELRAARARARSPSADAPKPATEITPEPVDTLAADIAAALDDAPVHVSIPADIALEENAAPIDDAAENAVEATAGEGAENAAENAAADIVEDTAEDASENAAADIVEDAAEDAAEDIVEDAAEDIVENAAEDAEQTVVEDAPADSGFPGAAPLACDAAESDLNQLPGVGPGLIWLLSEAGVRSMTDLINADRDALRERLGVLGQLIDLDGWIVLARKRSAETLDA